MLQLLERRILPVYPTNTDHQTCHSCPWVTVTPVSPSYSRHYHSCTLSYITATPALRHVLTGNLEFSLLVVWLARWLTSLLGVLVMIDTRLYAPYFPSIYKARVNVSKAYKIFVNFVEISNFVYHRLMLKTELNLPYMDVFVVAPLTVATVLKIT